MGVKLRLLPLIYCNRYCCSKKSIFSWELTPGQERNSLAVAGVGDTNLGDTQSHPKMLLYLQWD